ncbi:DUF2852 domain-containing protein [Xanthobacter sp. DSM 24535]|uniref:DUF2852 domain-containing protein n=1 Tax=Roseixanthobacter psychrophilus TaxID=3119917 RepID=UPI0037292ECE
MPIVAKLDDLGTGAWIALAVLGFVFCWPLGLAILAFTFWSGRMFGGTNRMVHWQDKMDRKMDRMRHCMNRAGGNGFWGPASSGNRAFDDYRAETLRRLEDEQREFKDFLERLRMAKDKSEFDQFMAERRRSGSSTPTPPNPEFQ